MLPPQEVKESPFVLLAMLVGIGTYSVRVSQMTPRSISKEIEVPIVELFEWLVLTGRTYHSAKVENGDPVVLGNVAPDELQHLGFKVADFLARKVVAPREKPGGNDPGPVLSKAGPGGSTPGDAEAHNVRFIPDLFEAGAVMLRLHFEGDNEPDPRAFFYYSRTKLEKALVAASLPVLDVCTVEHSGYWKITPSQTATLASHANELRL